MLHRDGGAAWARCERELREAGFALPLSYRGAVGGVRPWAGSWHLELRGADGRCRGGFPIRPRPLRVAPGHRLLRVERFGATVADADLGAAADALARLVRDDPRTLRLDVELFSPHAAARARIAGVLAERGFRPADPPNVYVDTLRLDLAPDEDALFAALHRSARRNVREVTKHGLVVRPITDPALADRLDALLADTLARTGGRHVPQDWAGRIRLAAEHPELARLVGLFRGDGTDADALLAFAWGCNHGDHGQYSDAASTRPADVRIPLAYALLWDLICWSRRNGAAWFDLGGVTRGTLGDDGDPLGGISDFKRFFTRDLVSVGEEWVLDSFTVRARFARAVHRRLQAS